MIDNGTAEHLLEELNALIVLFLIEFRNGLAIGLL